MVVLCDSKMGKNNNYNYNRFPGAAGLWKKSGVSNQRRHTHGREKRRPSTLMLWVRMPKITVRIQGRFEALDGPWLCGNRWKGVLHNLSKI